MRQAESAGLSTDSVHTNWPIVGGGRADYLVGYEVNDRMYGLDGADILYGLGGNDRLFGGNDADRVYGDWGHDRLFGGGGFDFLSGGAGNDLLFGDWGNDRLSGGGGHDQLYGGTGADVLRDGGGYDYLEGGAGADTFILTNDRWTDEVTIDEHDIIVLVDVEVDRIDRVDPWFTNVCLSDGTELWINGPFESDQLIC